MIRQHPFSPDWTVFRGARPNIIVAAATPTTTVTSATAPKIAEFTKWLQSMGHDQCNLRLSTFPPKSSTPGFGTIAGPGGFQQGDVIVKVPFQSFLSEETAFACPHIGPLIKKASTTPWQNLCLHLLFERAKGEKSKWYPYISLLPTELEMTERHPLLWPQGLGQDLLFGSPMLSKLERRINQCKEDCEAILAAGGRSLESSMFSSESLITDTSIRWAAAILLSRAFSLDLDKEDDDDDDVWSDDGQSVVLVPWADMLNHSSTAGKESCLQYDCDKQIAFLSAHKTYEEGDQVFDSYGPSLSPSELLLDYGFVDDANQNYSVDLPATLLGPCRSKRNEALLDAVGLSPSTSVFPITESGVDGSVLAWVRAAIASTEELEAAGWDEPHIFRAASAMAYFCQPISQDSESEVLQRIRSACGKVLALYPTSIEEDITSLNTDKLPWAYRQAKRALVSEKKALRGAWKTLFVLSKKLEHGANIKAIHKVMQEY